MLLTLLIIFSGYQATLYFQRLRLACYVAQIILKGMACVELKYIHSRVPSASMGVEGRSRGLDSVR